MRVRLRRLSGPFLCLSPSRGGAPLSSIPRLRTQHRPGMRVGVGVCVLRLRVCVVSACVCVCVFLSAPLFPNNTLAVRPFPLASQEPAKEEGTD